MRTRPRRSRRPAGAEAHEAPSEAKAAAAVPQRAPRTPVRMERRLTAALLRVPAPPRLLPPGAVLARASAVILPPSCIVCERKYQGSTRSFSLALTQSGRSTASRAALRASGTRTSSMSPARCRAGTPGQSTRIHA